MTIEKATQSLGMPWEKDYGYSQAVKVGDTIYLSGQVSHDDAGNIVGIGDMAAQMHATYANIRTLLEGYGATMDNVVDEITFVTDIETANAVSGAVRREAFGGTPVATSTLIGVQRLAFPELMVEIKCIARI